MPTLNLTVGASTDDVNHESINNDSGAAVTTGSVGAGDLTSVLLSPGSHGGNNEWSVGARFTAVTVPNAATISSASFSLKPQASYTTGGTISYIVSGQAADNAVTFAIAADLKTATRPRTTASTTWNQNSVTAGTRTSVDVTAQIQEIVNRAGWTSGNALVVIVDTAAATTLGEWQDYYAWDDATDRTNNPPQLTITYSTGSGSRAHQVMTRQAVTRASVW